MKLVKRPFWSYSNSESYLYDKKKEEDKTNKKVNRWIDKWGMRRPWWLKISSDTGYIF